MLALVVILMVRTYTLYDRSKKLLAFLFFFWSVRHRRKCPKIRRFKTDELLHLVPFRYSILGSYKMGHKFRPYVLLMQVVQVSHQLSAPNPFGACYLSNPRRIGGGLVCYFVLLVGETSKAISTYMSNS